VGADNTATDKSSRNELVSPAVTHRVHLVLASVVIAAISLVATQSATTAPLAPVSPSPVGTFERALANEFNAFSKRHGLRAALLVVRRQTINEMSTLNAADQRTLARGVLVWVNEMRLARADLQFSFRQFAVSPIAKAAAFSLPVPWRRTDAEAEISSYLWDNAPARNVRCRGVYDKGAWRDPVAGEFYFAHFRCRFTQNDGRSTFTMRVSNSATRFSTASWVLPHPASPPSGGGGGPQGETQSPSCVALGIALNPDGVPCQFAKYVYQRYRAGLSLPQFWECETATTGPRECGEVNGAEYAYPEFTW
jgi:hypothetical protein